MNISLIKITAKWMNPFMLILLLFLSIAACSDSSDDLDSIVFEDKVNSSSYDMPNGAQGEIIIAKKIDKAVLEDISDEDNLEDVSQDIEEEPRIINELQAISTNPKITASPSTKNTVNRSIKEEPKVTISDLLDVNGLTDFEFTGKANSNGMHSIWKIEKMIRNYFYLGNTEDEFNDFLPEAVNIYCLFGGDKTYRLTRLDSIDPYYLISDYTKSYNFNLQTGEISFQGIQNGGFFLDGNKAVFSYFNSDDGNWYCQTLTKINSLSGEMLRINNDELKVKMWNYYTREELSYGDGSSEGTIDIEINYNGSKKVSERSPIVALLRSTDENSSAAIAGNAINSKSDNSIMVTGIPDGVYYLFVIRLNDILKSVDPEPGDVYTIYDGSYYGGPDPAFIEISRGSNHNIAVTLDDTHTLPDDIKGEEICKLNSVGYVFEENEITVKIDIDTNAFDSDPLISAYLFAPASYRYGRARFDRGQIIEMDFLREGTSSAWEGAANLESYHESGTWKIGMIQVEGLINDDINLIGYSMEHNGIINDSYWYYDWSNESNGLKVNTDVKVPEFSYTSKESDVTGPELVTINGEENSGNTIDISLVVENSGSSGHRIDDYSMDFYPAKIYLFHEDSASSNIDSAYMLEFKDAPIVEDVYAKYTAQLDCNDLPEVGEWSVMAIQLIDGAGNSSYYFVYDDDIYTGIYNFWDNDVTYCLFNFGPELPMQTGIPMITIDKPAEPQIYAVGYYNMDSKFSKSEDDERIPCLWKNGVMTELERDYKSFACPQSVYVKDDTAYIAGYVYSETDPKSDGNVMYALACLWNNKEIRFLEENYFSKAYSVSVDNDAIYAAGYYRNDSLQYVACYWKMDGQSISRTDIVKGLLKKECPTRAKSIFVSEGVVYITGDYTDGAERKAYCWKYDTNGNKLGTNELVVDGFNDITANTMDVYENDVYIATKHRDHEQFKTIASLWINGEQDIIHDTTDASINSIFVSENAVYFCGNYRDLDDNELACYWKISGDYIERTDISGANEAKASCIYVSGKDIYISGLYKDENDGQFTNTACYWENGQLKKLSGYNAHNAEATAIFITR